MMELLIEHIAPGESNIITEFKEENTDGGKSKVCYLNGVLMQAEIKNRNGRIYPISEVTKAVSILKEDINTYGGIFGELDHPADRLSVNLYNVSHVITKLDMNGTDVVGRLKVLDTPMGEIVKSIAKSGVRFGVSSRGTGSVNESIVSNFRCTTIDVVATPSAYSYPTPVYESVQHLKSGIKALTLAEAIQHDEAAQKHFKKAIMQFLQEVQYKK